MNYNIMNVTDDMWSEIRESATYPYYVDGNTVYKVVKPKESKKEDAGYILQPISDYCRVSNVYTSLEAGHKLVSVEYCDSSTGELVKTPPFPRMYISDGKIQYLINYGISYHSLYKQDFSNYLCKSECTAIMERLHTSIGYKEICGELVYLLDEAVTDAPRIQSSYYSKTNNLSEKGDLETMTRTIQDNVLGKVGAEIVVLSSLSAAILPLLPYDMTDGQSLILSLVGDSSKGKTTIARFASSFYASPIHGGLFHDSYGTAGSLIGVLENTVGVTHVFDEREEFKKGGMGSEIYLLAGGSGKSRLDNKGNKREIGKFQVTAIFTSELMFTSDNVKTGQLLRFIELTDEHPLLHNDRESVEKIARISNDHYGVLGREWVKKLLAMDKRKLIANYKKYREMILTHLPANGYSARISKKYAVILTAGYFAKTFFDLDFNLENITQVFLDMEEKLRSSREMHERALDLILAFVAKNHAHFSLASNQCYGKIINTNWMGATLEDGEDMEIIIIKAILDDFLRRIGTDSAILKRLWRRFVTKALT